MCRCPSCRRTIPFSVILRSFLPRVRCLGCGTTLDGNWWVKGQSVFKLSALLGGAVGAGFWVFANVAAPLSRLLVFAVMTLVFTAAVAFPLAWITRRIGRFSRR